MTTQDRRPVPATQSNAIPPLSAVTVRRDPGALVPLAIVGVTGAALAAGVALVPTQAPVCGPDRASELSAHGPTVLRDLGRGAPLDALGELAVAMGWRAHTSTTTGGQMTGGAIAQVSPVPPVVPVPPTVEDHPRPMGAPPPMTVVPPERIVPRLDRSHGRGTHAHGDRTVPAVNDPTGTPGGGG